MDETKCSLCSFEGTDEDDLENHIIIVHADIFKTQKQILKYTEVDPKLKARPVVRINGFVCSYCNFKATSKQMLGLHIRKTHILFKFLGKSKSSNSEGHHSQAGCAFCEFAASNPEALLLHVQNHHDHQELECKTCQYRSTKAIQLMKHFQQSHIMEKEKKSRSKSKPKGAAELELFYCEMCNFSCDEFTALERHVQNTHLRQTDFANYVTRTLVKSLNTSSYSEPAGALTLPENKRKNRKSRMSEKKESAPKKKVRNECKVSRVEKSTISESDRAGYVTRTLLKALSSDTKNKASNSEMNETSPKTVSRKKTEEDDVKAKKGHLKATKNQSCRSETRKDFKEFLWFDDCATYVTRKLIKNLSTETPKCEEESFRVKALKLESKIMEIKKATESKPVDFCDSDLNGEEPRGKTTKRSTVRKSGNDHGSTTEKKQKFSEEEDEADTNYRENLPLKKTSKKKKARGLSTNYKDKPRVDNFEKGVGKMTKSKKVVLMKDVAKPTSECLKKVPRRRSRVASLSQDDEFSSSSDESYALPVPKKSSKTAVEELGKESTKKKSKGKKKFSRLSTFHTLEERFDSLFADDIKNEEDDGAIIFVSTKKFKTEPEESKSPQLIACNETFPQPVKSEFKIKKEVSDVDSVKSLAENDYCSYVTRRVVKTISDSPDAEAVQGNKNLKPQSDTKTCKSKDVNPVARKEKKSKRCRPKDVDETEIEECFQAKSTYSHDPKSEGEDHTGDFAVYVTRRLLKNLL